MTIEAIMNLPDQREKWQSLTIKAFERFLLYVLLTYYGFVGCAVQGEKETPGQCKISCSGAKAGAYEFVLTPMQGDINFDCGKYYAEGETWRTLGTDVVLKFSLTNEVSDVALDSGKFVETKKKVPVGNIKFTPQILGVMDADFTDPENGKKVDSFQTDPSGYAGIRTPKSEWCTDSCGVATLKIRPVCVRGGVNEVTVDLKTGAGPNPEESKPSKVIMTSPSEEQ